MSWCRPGAMVLGECGDATVKLLWFSCCRLRLVPHGVAAELRGNRFSTEAGLLLGVGLGLTEAAVESGRGRIVRGRFGPAEAAMEPEARLSYEVDLGPPRWRRSSGETDFPRKRACFSGSAWGLLGSWGLLGWLWGREAGISFEVGLGFAETAAEP